MVAPRYRSGRHSRVHKRTPGGETKLTFQRKNPKTPKCASCGKELKGIPRLRISKAKKAAKSQKTVSRAYGGFLCASCLRDKLKAEARSIQ